MSGDREELSEPTVRGDDVRLVAPRWEAALDSLQQFMWQISEDHGFHEDLELLHALVEFAGERPTLKVPTAELLALVDGLYDSQKLKLIHDELSEAHEEARSGRRPDEVYYVCKNCLVETGASEASWEPVFTDCCRKPDLKPEGIPIEVADAVIRALDFAQIRGFSVAEAIRIKMEYNRTRPHKHGRRF